MENKYETFRRYNYQRPFSAGVGKEKRNYTVMVTWLEKCVKRKILFVFIQGRTARTRKHTINGNFFTLVYTTS